MYFHKISFQSSTQAVDNQLFVFILIFNKQKHLKNPQISIQKWFKRKER